MNQFNYEEELGNYLVSSGLLQDSWSTISKLNGQTHQIDPSLPLSVKYKRFNGNNPSDTVIVFSCSPICSVQHLQGEGKDLVSSAELKENFNFPVFDYLSTNYSPSFSIHRAAIQLYQSLHGQLVQEKIDTTKPLIITGHSLGGSVASLFTLWLLHTIYSKMDRKTKPPICITFGSPLLGDDSLQEAISGRPLWASCFVHVVSKYDPIPRLFIRPRNTILSDSNVQDYKPFGLFLFCSESGVACFVEPDIVLELLNTLNSQSLQFIDYGYGLVLEALKDNAICRGSRLGGWDNNPLRTGITLQLQAIGVDEMQTQQRNNDLIGRIEIKQKESLKCRTNALDLDKKLNQMKINMACLEWYKKITKNRGGYYDSYKYALRNADECKSKQGVITPQRKLTSYWKKTVAEAKRTDGNTFPLRFLWAGNNYRRMVEPLDIAEYYKVYKQGQKDYWAQGRSEHYILLEKWLEDKEPSNARQRKSACSFNEDSCFWAYVEEALISLTVLKDEKGCPENRELFRKLNEFEEYVMDSINKQMVDPEIFLEGSSFMRWWSIYSSKKGSFYNSRLANYMRNNSYRAYS